VKLRSLSFGQSAREENDSRIEDEFMIPLYDELEIKIPKELDAYSDPAF
jgi:hypothetical protein